MLFNGLKDLTESYYNKSITQLGYLDFLYEKFNEEKEILYSNDLIETTEIYQKLIFFTKIVEVLSLDEEGKIDSSNAELIETLALIIKNVAPDLDVNEYFETCTPERLKQVLKMSVESLVLPENGCTIVIEDDVLDERYGKVFVKFASFEARSRFLDFRNRQYELENQMRIFLQTSLIDATNSFEYFVYNILEFLIKSNPESIDKSKKQVEFREILMFEDIDELKKIVVDDYLKDIMWESRKTWFKEIEKRNKNFKKNFPQSFYNEIEECFEVRNAIVHNGSMVNQDCKKYFSNAELNENIPLTIEYIKRCSEILIINGIRISYILTLNEKKDLSPKMTFFEQDIIFHLVKIGRSEIAEQLYSMLWSDVSLGDNEYRLRTAINYALSLKKQGKEFEHFIKAVDFSVCGNEHKLCLAALNNQIESVMLYFEATTKDNENILDYTTLVQWPVLKNIISEDVFIQFAKEKYPEESSFFYPSDEFDDIMISEEVSDYDGDERN